MESFAIRFVYRILTNKGIRDGNEYDIYSFLDVHNTLYNIIYLILATSMIYSFRHLNIKRYKFGALILLEFG